LNAVAVGVTMRTVLAAVTELGADSAQGFFISPPINADRVLDIAARPVAATAPAAVP
jgi:EAL domain-containing protein (putative c-di-GMP-specific phosphodiesterase class I)